jgi:hypothetical protein
MAANGTRHRDDPSSKNLSAVQKRRDWPAERSDELVCPTGCGWHYSHFDRHKGQAEYGEKVNRILGRYDDGFELTDRGQVERGLPQQVADLAALPDIQESSDEVHIAEALRKYRSRVGLDRRDAVRNLADVLERLRPTVKEHLFSKDEGALFQIANQFWVRHNDPDQRKDYKHDAWWDWLFHLYLSSIRLVQRLDAEAAKPAEDR